LEGNNFFSSEMLCLSELRNAVRPLTGRKIAP
jgi:hypothetical protein